MLGDGAGRDAAHGFFANPWVTDKRLYMLLKPLPD